MTIIIAIIAGFVAGILGSFVAAYIADHCEPKEVESPYVTRKQIDYMLEDFNNNVIIDIGEIRNDLNKMVWLDDLTIKGLNDQVGNLNKKVDEHFRWSLGVWNDISVLVDPKLKEEAKKIEESIDTVPVELDDNLRPMGPVTGPDGAKWIQDTDKQGWTEENDA